MLSRVVILKSAMSYISHALIHDCKPFGIDLKLKLATLFKEVCVSPPLGRMRMYTAYSTIFANAFGTWKLMVRQCNRITRAHYRKECIFMNSTKFQNLEEDN